MRGVNPPKEATRRERAVEGAHKAESWLYRHSSVIAAFLAGIITGYWIGA